MPKAAVTLISLEAGQATIPPQPPTERTDELRGIFTALVHDAVGDLLTQAQGDFDPVQMNRASSAQEAITLVEKSDTAFLLSEITHPNDAFQVLVALKLLKSRIETGQVRAMVVCTLPSKTLIDKLRLYGCTEIVTSLDHSEKLVQKARILVELLLFRRAVSRLPGGKFTSIGMAFLLSEWMSQMGIDYPSMAHLFCACLSASFDGATVEILRHKNGAWECLGTSECAPEKRAVEMTGPVEIELRSPTRVIEWIGEKTGAVVCWTKAELTQEQSRLLQAAAELSKGLIFHETSPGDLQIQVS